MTRCGFFISRGNQGELPRTYRYLDLIAGAMANILVPEIKELAF